MSLVVWSQDGEDETEHLHLRVQWCFRKDIIIQPAKLVLLTTHFEDSPVSADQVTEAIRRVPVLPTVTQYVNRGWPTSIPGQPERSYFDKQKELLTFEGCLLWPI